VAGHALLKEGRGKIETLNGLASVGRETTSSRLKEDKHKICTRKDL